MEQENYNNVPNYGARPTTWPILWGVVSIVFGVVGALYQAFKAFQAGIMLMVPTNMYSEMANAAKTGDPKRDKMMEGMMKSQGEMMAGMQELAPMTMGAAIALVVLALLLVVGGIMLCMRKRVASPTLQTWAVLKFIAGGFSAWVAYRMMTDVAGSYGDMMRSIIPAGSGTSGTPNVGGMMGTFAKVFIVLNLIWVFALPTYFLVWFNREPVKEDMKSGAGW